MKRIIFLDLDDVLVDLDRGLLELAGVTLPRERTPENKIAVKQTWSELAKIPTLWYNMPPMPQATELYNGILKYSDPIILSATPEEYEFDHRHDACKTQKIAWVEKHFGPLQAMRTIITKSKLKQDYIKEFDADEHILIDDFMSNIIRWREAGGVGIHHTDNDTTLSELEKIYE